MPSNKDPSVVEPGPGKLAAGQVPASALAFPFSGSGDLAAHIGDPIDAHMASAIGVPETDPNTGAPLLGSAGGPYDGESVSDALTALAQLFPVKPDKIGFDAGGVPNSGIPAWGNPLTVGGSGLALHGGWTNAGAGVITKYVSISAASFSPLTGMVYPGDRGVLAVYKTTEGDFFNPSETTLVAALWLGQSPPPPGMPGAGFLETTRATGQTDYTASNTGLDKISLTDRLPYFDDYPGLEYTAFGQNFNPYQLAKYAVDVSLPGAADADSYLFIHWREQFANTLAGIQPVNLTLLNFTADNTYSAVTGTGLDNVQRLNIYQTIAGSPTPGAATITPAGSLTTQKLSGIDFYNSATFALDILGTCTGLFNGYFTNTVASVSVPAGYESNFGVAAIDLSDFGGTEVPYQLYDDGTPNILNHGTALPYTLVSPPAIGQTARVTETGRLVNNVTRHAVRGDWAQPAIVWRNPGAAAAPASDSNNQILYDTWDTSTALAADKQTDTQDHFVLEDYRYVGSYVPSSAALPILPSGGSDFDSTVKRVSDDGELQCWSGRLVYPSANFSAASTKPVQSAGADYSAVQLGDSTNHKRRYLRAFDTGIPRNTGKIRIKINAPGPQVNLFLASFAGSNVIDPSEVGDHAGGMILQIKVPGLSGWLDLGRADGVPDLIKSQDFKGCRTALSGDGTPEMIFSYDSQFFTADNGSGKFLIFVRVSIINPNTNLYIDEIEWLPP